MKWWIGESANKWGIIMVFWFCTVGETKVCMNWKNCTNSHTLSVIETREANSKLWLLNCISDIMTFSEILAPKKYFFHWDYSWSYLLFKLRKAHTRSSEEHSWMLKGARSTARSPAGLKDFLLWYLLSSTDTSALRYPPIASLHLGFLYFLYLRKYYVFFLQALSYLPCSIC